MTYLRELHTRLPQKNETFTWGGTVAQKASVDEWVTAKEKARCWCE